MPANHLIHEKSPYLQQHAHNPVEWYPWGAEAFDRARTENKPVFLSIGYSTCHWCHVMEHESFENAEVAALMNTHFINIKVDREERPDLDHVYMTSVQLTTGSGGWPMSVWLTPDQRPFFAGTYFPPDERYGRPGFKRVLAEIARIWTEEPEKVRQSAIEITKAVQETLSSVPNTSQEEIDSAQIRDAAFRELSRSYDPQTGGFGRAPKFPMPGYLSFLLYYYGKTHQETALSMVRTTWNRMTAGGIYDQLGGGFARYSTDTNWIVPHFEKMLYDNAQLSMVGVHLFQLTGDPSVRTIVEETLNYLLRDLRSPEGAFYSAEDADSEGQEGRFYVWTLAEFKKVLPADLFDAAVQIFGVTAHGNFSDPHAGAAGQNILVKNAVEVEKQNQFEKIRTVLFDFRSKRVRPHRDEKILTEWNGLAISAFARAGRAFSDKRWTEAAQASAEFLKKNLWDEQGQILYRRWRDGDRKIPAFQSDYAFLVQGLIDVFQATGNSNWLEWALVLHGRMNDLFNDVISGGYFQTEEKRDVLVRFKEDQDNVIPSGNSIGALNGFRLARLSGKAEDFQKAAATVRFFAPSLKTRPTASLQMVIAASLEKEAPAEVVIMGSGHRWEELLAVTARVSDPAMAVIPIGSSSELKRLARLIPAAVALKETSDGAAAYVCANFSCQAPTSDPKQLARLIFLGESNG